MTARVGYRSPLVDLPVMLEAGCYERNEGHRWSNQWTQEPAAADPHCKACRATMRQKMQDRGLVDTQIQHLFRIVGARWDWGRSEAKPPTEEQKRLRKMRQAAQIVPQRRLGDHIVWVEELTEEMRRANQQLDDARAAVEKQREEWIETQETVDPVEMKRRFPMPDLPCYRVKTAV